MRIQLCQYTGNLFDTLHFGVIPEMAERIKILCEQLLRAQDITVIELVAEELESSIRAYVENAEQRAPNRHITLAA